MILKKLPFNVNLLLFVSFLLTISRSLIIPFMAIYLSKSIRLQQSEIGIIIGGSLFVSTLLGVYGGYLVDRINKVYFLISCIGLLSFIFICLPFLQGKSSLFIALRILNFSFILIDIITKVYFSVMLESSVRVKVFSLKYTLTNIAYAIGPILGSILALISTSFPFVISSIISVGTLTLVILNSRKLYLTSTLRVENNSYLKTIKSLGQDRRLFFFTLGGVFSAIAYDPFSTYLAQYMSVIYDKPEKFYHLIAYIISINAIVVISLQYFFSLFIKEHNLMCCLLIGTFFLVLGELGFSFSHAYFMWFLCIFVFSLGEIIIVPAEYMFIDSIAPTNLKGSYFGIQSLARLGSSLGPLICGIMLDNFLYPNKIFFVLISSSILGVIFYYIGNCLIDSKTRKEM